MTKKKIAITIGDPAGIGPEIIIKTLNSINIDKSEYLLIGNKKIFEKTSQDIKLPLDENIEIIDIPCDVSEILIGKPTAQSGKLSFLAIETACKMTKEKKISAIVTAPISKKAINMAGYHYSGHTEILQEYLAEKEEISSFSKLPLYTHAEMLFVARDFRVLLLTRHIKLADISKSLNINKIIETVYALNSSLIRNFKINNPRIAMCALNPHAGEDGLMGNEEEEIIIPALARLREEYNILIEGPYPSDTLWRKASVPFLKNEPQPYDVYVACYHDQGLTPVKMLAMDMTVNVTINLPTIRTSPAHGTAYDIAGKNMANPDSMIHAFELAYKLR